MSQRVFQFRLPPRERRRVVEMFNALGAIGLDDDQFEAGAAGRRPRFAPDKAALSLVEPDHRLSIFQETPSLA